MHYLKIADDHYCSDELAGLVSSGLSLLGLDSYKTIRVSTKNNRISIGFKSLEDATPQERSLVFQHTPGTKHLGVEM